MPCRILQVPPGNFFSAFFAPSLSIIQFSREAQGRASRLGRRLRGAADAKHIGDGALDAQGKKQIMAIATQKMPDMNANTVEAAAKTIRGTARSMGIEVVA